MGKHSSSAFQTYSNTEKDEEDPLVTINDAETELTDFVKDLNTKPIEATPQMNEEAKAILTCSSFEDLENPEEYEQLLEQFEFFSNENEIMANTEEITDEGIKYIAGYVAYKYKNKYMLYENTETMSYNNEYSWTHFLSKGQLFCPNEDLLKLTKNVREEFNIFHGTNLNKKPYIFNRMAEKMKHKTDLPKEVIMRIIRIFTYIRLRNLNRLISDSNLKKKNKIKKFLK